MARTAFWNLIARRYARQPVPDEAVYRRKLDQTRAVLRPDTVLFEFGCGTGTTALHHAPFVAQIEAIDFSRNMIAIARHKAAAQGAGNVRFEVAGIEDWPAPAGSYDVILAMSVLHLVADRAAVLAGVRRLIRPDGWFFSSTTCLGGMAAPMRGVLRAGSALRLLPELRIFTEDRLVADIEAAGFRIEDRWSPGPGKAVFIAARPV